MMRRIPMLLVAVAVTAIAVPLMAQDDSPTPAKTADQAAGPAEEVVIDYSGKLQDESGKPVSGVFNLEFRLYDGQHAARSKWSERHFVAVVDGSYTVPLGAETKLRRDRVPPEAWIGVELVGEGELLRDRFALADQVREPSSGGDAEVVEMAVSEETRKLLEQAKESNQVTFADIAERAVTAEQAEVAKRAQMIGELSAQDLEEKANIALKRLGDHIADPGAHDAAGGLSLTDERRVQRRVGGPGGDDYEVNCPPGHVVTGIKGGAGKMLDSISIVCTKLR